MAKAYARDPTAFKDLATGFGSCFASDRITVDGLPVGLMYREKPDNNRDSGWRFFAGDESDDYCNDPAKMGLFDVNTIANYDPVIIEYLASDMPPLGNVRATIPSDVLSADQFVTSWYGIPSAAKAGFSMKVYGRSEALPLRKRSLPRDGPSPHFMLCEGTFRAL